MSSNAAYDNYLEHARQKHGEKFDESGLAPQFVQYFRTGTRIKVQTTYSSGEKYERTGIVGITTGWRPAFLLMHRRTDRGSSDVLSSDDRVIAVHNGDRYVS